MANTVWKGQLTFGLVSMPVKLFSAARSETINFNLLHATDHSRVKQVLFCQAEDKPVGRNELVKAYEYEKDKYVVVDEDDIKRVAPPSSKVMEILEFVKSGQVDPVHYESSYYMAPDQAGEKPYALLFEALKRSGYVGIAKIAMHTREHIVILRPGKSGILLHTMYYEDEVREMEEFRADTISVKEKELELAMTLITALATDFEPRKYKDLYRENLMALIQAKVQGRQVIETPAARQLAPVIDIMDALKASLALGKKPVRSVASEQRAARAPQDVAAARGKRGRKTSGGS